MRLGPSLRGFFAPSPTRQASNSAPNSTRASARASEFQHECPRTLAPNHAPAQAPALCRYISRSHVPSTMRQFVARAADTLNGEPARRTARTAQGRSGEWSDCGCSSPARDQRPPVRCARDRESVVCASSRFSKVCRVRQIPAPLFLQLIYLSERSALQAL